MDETAAFQQGVDNVDAENGGPTQEEREDVKRWLKRIDDARKFDENARKRYAVDRRYARGDRGMFEVGLPIAGTYIDILKSFLYATDPDLDAQPSDGTTPPPMADILKLARQQVTADPATGQAMDAAAQQAMQTAVAGAVQSAIGTATGAQPQQPAPPPDPQQAGQQAAQAKLDELTRARADQIIAPYRQRAAEAKQLGQTIESSVRHLWRQARLKSAAEPWVASGFTVGLGWIKATWQERRGRDPMTSKQINDLQDNLARLNASREELSEGELSDQDAAAERASIQQQIEALNANVEVVLSRGFAIDFVAAEDIQVSLNVPSLTNYQDADWIAHRTFVPLCDAKAVFPDLDDDELKKAAIYHQKRPVDTTDKLESGGIADVHARDADSYKEGGAVNATEEGSVCVWEVWDRTGDHVITLIHGLDRYAKQPYTPDPGTSRFYPFFQYAPLRCDGERHPQSMIQRTQSLLDDMNRIYSNRAEHRRRCLPKTAFNKRQVSPDDAKALSAGAIGEMVGVEPTEPLADLSRLVTPVAYPAIDMALYDDAPTRAMLEMAWGIQEALASTIQTAKTATEAEIQQTGTQARTGYMRNCLDDSLSDFALYSTEVALQKLSYDDVKQIAGPFAFWPQGIGLDQISALVLVQIRAGSSGKPNTTAQRKAWAETMPIVQNALGQIAQLRGSNPEDVADCIEELVSETLQRTGDKIDPARFLPSAPDNGGGAPPTPVP